MGAVILVADDEPWLRLWIARVLHSAGYVCAVVADGEDVVGQALATAPRLLILDVELPNVDGREVARRLRILPTTREVPILFVAGDDRAAAELATASGHAAMLGKPFQAEDLLAAVNRLLT